MTTIDVSSLPEAPPCTTWCQGHPKAQIGRWDAVNGYQNFTEAVSWCRRSVLVGEVEVVLERFMSWHSEEDRIEVEPTPHIMIEPTEYSLTEVEQLVTVLTAALQVSR